MTKQADVKRKQEQLAKQLKSICNETGRPKEKDILTVVRSAVRKAWQFSPTKVSLLIKGAVYVEDVPKELRPSKLTANSKWLYKCRICEKYYIQSKIQVDHIVGEHPLKTYEDMVGFTRAILDVSWDDLRILCIECHSIATYAERYGVTLEQAKKEKAVIGVMNTKAKGQRAFLIKHKVKPDSNESKRREQIRGVLNGETS